MIPQGFRPAVDKGIQEAMAHGELAGSPVQGVRVALVDGSYHTVDSSEMAFKIAGSMAFKAAYEKANPVLLEPIMEVEVDRPRRRGRRGQRRPELAPRPAAGDGAARRDDDDQGRGADGGGAHVLAVADLADGRPRRLPLHFLRYEEVPTHIAQKIIEETQKARDERGRSADPAVARRREDIGHGRAAVRDLRAHAADGRARVRFAPRGEDYVDVCPLCQEARSTTAGSRRAARRADASRTPRRRRALRRPRRCIGSAASAEPEHVVAEPILRRLSERRSRRMVEAADLFNAAHYRRTVAGIAKSLGEPRVSIVAALGRRTPRSWSRSPGTSPGTSTASSPSRRQPVRLAERGHELDELDDRFRDWNAPLEAGRPARSRTFPRL